MKMTVTVANGAAAVKKKRMMPAGNGLKIAIIILLTWNAFSCEIFSCAEKTQRRCKRLT